MTVSLPALYAEAWTNPRQSMRRMLGMKLTERDRLMMVVFGLVLFSVPLVVLLRALPPIPGTGSLTTGGILIACVFFIGFGVLGYYLVAWIIKTVGAGFGGTGSYEDCKTASAWSQLVTGIANAFVMLAGFVAPESIGSMLRFAVSIAGVVVLSAYIAEAHGFKSILKVAMVAFLIMAGIAVMLDVFVLSGLPR